MRGEIALQIGVHVRWVGLVHDVLLRVLDPRRREVVESGIEDGVGVDGCEQRVQVRVGLEQSRFTVVVGGRKGRELNVNNIIGVGRIAGNLSLCVMVSICSARPRRRSTYLRRPEAGWSWCCTRG